MAIQRFFVAEELSSFAEQLLSQKSAEISISPCTLLDEVPTTCAIVKVQENRELV